MSRQEQNLLVFADFGCFLRFLSGKGQTKSKQTMDPQQLPQIGVRKPSTPPRWDGVED
jgi:hypothetical protein